MKKIFLLFLMCFFIVPNVCFAVRPIANMNSNDLITAVNSFLITNHSDFRLSASIFQGYSDVNKVYVSRFYTSNTGGTFTMYENSSGVVETAIFLVSNDKMLESYVASCAAFLTICGLEEAEIMNLNALAISNIQQNGTVGVSSVYCAKRQCHCTCMIKKISYGIAFAYAMAD